MKTLGIWRQGIYPWKAVFSVIPHLAWTTTLEKVHFSASNFPRGQLGMCLVVCGVPLHLLSFCWEDEQKVAVVWAPGNAPGPSASGELLALSVTMTVVQPASWLPFRGHIKTSSSACLFKGSAPMAGILISFSVHHFPTSGFHILLSRFIIHDNYFYSICYPKQHNIHLFFNSKWGKRTTVLRPVSGKHDMWPDLRRTGYYWTIL